ncbi:hypothetical protein [Edaphobacter bradus]|uniref:hypothetical protein n=1 Tax=Edaphobacter bradus TaxID=2259016 RepID=UPI0021E02CCF|nr:hypothetical protein [Edaphobacter bradus]
MTKTRNPKWTEDELILTLDAYLDMRTSDISASNPKIVALSETLNALRSADKVDDKFRNPNGVALKMHNFSQYDPSRTARGMNHGGRLDKVIWDRFEGKRAQLRKAADLIRSKLAQVSTL